MTHFLLTLVAAALLLLPFIITHQVIKRRGQAALKRRLAVQNEAWRKMEAFRKSGAERTIMFYTAPSGKGRSNQ